jgi:hypothetical protein
MKNSKKCARVLTGDHARNGVLALIRDPTRNDGSPGNCARTMNGDRAWTVDRELRQTFSR